MNGDGNAQELLRVALEELGREEVVAVLKSSLAWGALGALLGLLLSGAIHFGYRRLGWYACGTTGGRWALRLALVLVTVLCIALGALAGLGEGVHRRAHDAVAHSRIGTQLLPPVSDLAAEACSWLYLAVETGRAPDQAAAAARLQAFRDGRWELDVQEFLDRAAALRDGTFAHLLGQLEQSIFDRYTDLRGGTIEQAVRTAIRRVGPHLLEARLSEELERRGVEPIRVAIRDRLVAEAARRGEPRTIGFADLSDFLRREGIIPAIVTPVRTFIRQQQVLFVGLALAACLVPGLVCRACRARPVPPAAPPPALADQPARAARR